MALNRFKKMLNEYGRQSFAGYGKSLFTYATAFKLFNAITYIAFSEDNLANDRIEKTLKNWCIQALLRDNPTFTKEKLETIAFNHDGKYRENKKKIEQRHYFFFAEHIVRTTEPDSPNRLFLKRTMKAVLKRAGTGNFNSEMWNKYIPVVEKSKTDIPNDVPPSQ